MRFKFGFPASTHSNNAFEQKARASNLKKSFGIEVRELTYQLPWPLLTVDPHWEHLSTTTHKRATVETKIRFTINVYASEPHQLGCQGNWLVYLTSLFHKKEGRDRG
jgi:hypothetical protein